MNEVKTPKRPIISYYILMLILLLMFNLIVVPMMQQAKIETVDYSKFMSSTRSTCSRTRSCSP